MFRLRLHQLFTCPFQVWPRKLLDIDSGQFNSVAPAVHLVGFLLDIHDHQRVASRHRVTFANGDSRHDSALEQRESDNLAARHTAVGEHCSEHRPLLCNHETRGHRWLDCNAKRHRRDCHRDHAEHNCLAVEFHLALPLRVDDE